MYLLECNLNRGILMLSRLMSRLRQNWSPDLVVRLHWQNTVVSLVKNSSCCHIQDKERNHFKMNCAILTFWLEYKNNNPNLRSQGCRDGHWLERFV